MLLVAVSVASAAAPLQATTFQVQMTTVQLMPAAALLGLLLMVGMSLKAGLAAGGVGSGTVVVRTVAAMAKLSQQGVAVC